MSVPSARRRTLRRIRRAAAVGAGVCFAGVGVAVTRVFTSGASPLPAAGAVYFAAAFFGVGEMAKLRERVLFHPTSRPPPHSTLAWWATRVVIVMLASTIPAVLLLGGLTRR